MGVGSGIKLLSINGCSFGVMRCLQSAGDFSISWRDVYIRVLVTLAYCDCAKCKWTEPFKIINFTFHEFYHKKTKTHIQSSLDPRPWDGRACSRQPAGHQPSFPSSASCSPLCPHTCPASPVHAQASSLDCSSWRKRGKEHFKKKPFSVWAWLGARGHGIFGTWRHLWQREECQRMRGTNFGANGFAGKSHTLSLKKQCFL